MSAPPKVEYHEDDDFPPLPDIKRARISYDEDDDVYPLCDIGLDCDAPSHAIEFGAPVGDSTCVDGGVGSAPGLSFAGEAPCAGDLSAGLAVEVAPPPQSQHALPAAVAQSSGDGGNFARRSGREGEFEMWFGHRFTKVKRCKAWTGWQVVCSRHTDSRAGASAKCNRARTFRGVRGMDEGDPAFIEESERTLNILRHWVVGECDPSNRAGHMLLSDVDPGDFLDELALETVARLYELGGRPARHADADQAAPDVASDTGPPARVNGDELGGAESGSDSSASDTGSTSSSGTSSGSIESDMVT